MNDKARMSLNDSQTSSFMRKRLVAGVRHRKGGKDQEKSKGRKKNKVDMLNMNEEEFAKYLEKKYG
jgi:hypothetical protein